MKIITYQVNYSQIIIHVYLFSFLYLLHNFIHLLPTNPFLSACLRWCPFLLISGCFHFLHYYFIIFFFFWLMYLIISYIMLCSRNILFFFSHVLKLPPLQLSFYYLNFLLLSNKRLLFSCSILFDIFTNLTFNLLRCRHSHPLFYFSITFFLICFHIGPLLTYYFLLFSVFLFLFVIILLIHAYFCIFLLTLPFLFLFFFF